MGKSLFAENINKRLQRDVKISLGEDAVIAVDTDLFTMVITMDQYHSGEEISSFVTNHGYKRYDFVATDKGTIKFTFYK